MPVCLLGVILSLLAGLAAANLDATHLAEAVRSIGGLPLAVGLTNLTGALRMLGGPMLPIVCGLQCVIARDATRSIVARCMAVARKTAERHLIGSCAGPAIRLNAAVAAFCLPLLTRVLKRVVSLS